MEAKSKSLSNLSDVERDDFSNDEFIRIDDILYKKFFYTKKELIKERRKINQKEFWGESVHYYIVWFVLSLLTFIKNQSVRDVCLFFFIPVSLMSVYYCIKYKNKISKHLDLLGRKFRIEKVDENELSDAFKELIAKSRKSI